jgi:ABC-type hemin transport system substrate-binding protein
MIGELVPRAVLALIVVIGSVGCAQNESEVAVTASRSATPTRIVSLAPSVTEVLYELGVGQSVVGVTPDR